MAYKQFPTDKYVDELRQELVLQAKQIPTIKLHNAELRARVRPSVGEMPQVATENEMRSTIINELSKVLKASDVPNVIEHLSKANDLKSFYNFSKPFLAQVKDVRNLDASYLLNLWSRFKSQLLIETSPQATATPFPTQTAAEYERKVRAREVENKRLADEIRMQQSEARLLNKEVEQTARRPKLLREIRKPRLKIDTSEGMSNLPVYKALHPATATELLLESNPYGYKLAKAKKGELVRQYQSVPRKHPVSGPTKNGKGAKGRGIGDTILARR